ncbi:DUF3048 domain-containing protein [Virgibacillus sp. MSP4-1]|uniref:DUF3048 domain-containing protein n=1 Tax=Virgibacillus sp. MSP4-1 TaxID=2700081 RepID=UPI0003A61063
MKKGMQKCSILLFLMIVLFLTACSNEGADDQESEEKAKEEQPVVEPEPSEEPPEPEYENTYPLTGIGTNEPVNNRIIGVMVNNHTKARPQSGLSKADIVYELLAEGPITRFLAFFHSEKPEVVGPVRSAREYYANLAQGMGAIYIYHGAAHHIEDIIMNKDLDLIRGAIHDDDRYLFKRESFRAAPHDSYLIYPNVYEAAEQKGIDIKQDNEPYPFLTQDEVSQISGEEASRVHIVYHEGLEEVTYEYDEVNEQYVRYSDGEKTVELETEEPVVLDNIFVVETGHRVIDSAHRRAIDLESGGRGYLVQKGKVQEVEWKNVDGRILPFKNGEKVKFVPGKTWVNVVPETPGIDQSVQFN